MAFRQYFITFRQLLLPLLLFFYLHVGESIVCYKCDSLTLEECAMSLNVSELPIEDCRTSIQCVMSIVDAVTYRGCSSDTPTADATYKKTCGENLCNKGVYPPGRMKCYHCAGADCADQPAGKPHPCRWHHEIDQCYTEVVADLSIVYRGCESDTNHTIASDSGVAYCDINGCNDQAALATLRCAQCDSAESLGCKTDLFALGASMCNISQYEVCETRTLFTQPRSCFYYHNLDRVVRGCSADLPTELFANEEYVTECNGGDMCNAVCTTQQRCVTCDSAISSKCLNDASEYAVTICGSAEASSCYASEYANWQVRRGCGPLPTESELPDRNRFYECNSADEDKCNATPFTRCYQCTSAVNTNCANWDRPGFDVSIEECAQPGARCIMAAWPNGPTLRGCESDELHCNETMATCATCSGNFCNAGQFPTPALRCHQCENCPQVLGMVDAMPCLPQLGVVAGSSEACFEYYLPLVGMIRGCRSNSAQYFQCVHQNANAAAAGCRVCSTDGCNNSSAVATPTFSCYTCDRSDFSCQDDQHAAQGSLLPCMAGAPFGYSESCFVTRHLDGTTTRGCSWDQLSSSASQLWDETTYCTHATGCNSMATRSQFCARCQTDLSVDANDSCASAAFQLEPVLCSSAVSGCYMSIAGSTLNRGCSSELTSAQYERCITNEDSNCYLCQGQKCNVIKAPTIVFPTLAYRSSSEKVTKSTLAFITSVIVGLKLCEITQNF